MNESITIVVPLGEKRETDFLNKFDKEKNNAKIIVVKSDNPSRNRNYGASRANTDYVAFVNGHSILSDNWTNEVENFFSENPEISVVGGPQLDSPDDTFFARVSGYAFSSVFGAGNVVSRYKEKKMNLDADETSITSANLICKREVLDKIKFDESIWPGEDPKFISDAKKQGFKVAYTPKIKVFHRRRGNILALIKQIYNYGKFRPKKESFRETLKRPVFLIPSLFFIYFIFIVLYMLTGRFSLAFLFPLLLYGALNLLFSSFNSLKNKNIPALFILPFIYLSIHLSYGSGFLFSSVKNIFKKRK